MVFHGECLRRYVGLENTFQMSLQPAECAFQKMAQGVAMMPEPAVEPVGEFCGFMFFAATVERGDHGDHLVVANTGFFDELVIPHAGIGVWGNGAACRSIL